MVKVWKFLRKMSMKKFLSVKLQTYSVQTATLLLRYFAHHRYFLGYVPRTSCFKKQYFEKKLYGRPAS